MNGETGSSPEEEIVERILTDGEAQAARVIDGAKRSEAAEKRKAQGEAEKLRKEALAQAESKAKALRSKEIASAKIEAKRLLLRAREEAVSKVFSAVEREVAKIRENPEEYRRVLISLAVEATAAVGGSRVILRTGEDDQALMDDGTVEQIIQGVAKRTGSRITVNLESDPTLHGGGCVAASADGRVVFDNSFRRRLERMKPELRSVIAKEVLKANG
jgi:vacuolar-type H+-ATPase subunit E/Vma4